LANAFNGTPRWPDPVVYGSYSPSGLANDFPVEVIKAWRKFTYDSNWNIVEDFAPNSNSRTFYNNIFLPTATPGTNNTQAATTAFVQAAIAAGGGGSGGTVTYTTNTTASTSDNGKLVVMNCSVACAYTLPNPQPSTTWYANVVTVGSTNATIALGATITFNLASPVPALNKFRMMKVYANSTTATDYEGEAPLVASTNITNTPASNGFSQAATGTGGSNAWSCQPGLGDGLNAMAAGTYLSSTCMNTTGSTVTISGVKCFTDNSGSSTMNAAGNTLGALLTGAVTCSSSFAAGTQSANVLLTNGDYIKFTFVADGTSKQSTWVVMGTY
jgi:hypothetical protein